MTPQSEEDIIAVAVPSPPRRWMGIAMFVVLGAILIWLAAATPASALFRMFFLAVGAAALWMANFMRLRSTEGVVLTKEELRTESGQVLARVSNIKGVERGALAFKPSNGFLVRLNSRGAPGWAPGVWWRRGTLLGIGGILASRQSRAMADILTALASRTDSEGS